MLTLEIDFSGLSGGVISASAVAQGYLGGQETPISAGEGSGLAEISAIQGVAPPEALTAIEEGLTGNRLLRPARRSDFVPGRRSRVSVRSGNTNPRGKVLPMPKYQCCKAEQHKETSASIFSDSR